MEQGKWDNDFLQAIARRRRESFCNLLLVVINIIVFLVAELCYSFTDIDLIERGALSADYVWQDGEYYRLITCMFLHAGMSHLVNNMLILWFLGDTLEKQIGHIKFLLIYFSTGILAGIASMGYNNSIGRSVVCVGASGAIFGVVGAVAFLILAHRGRMAGLTTRQIVLFIILSLYGGFTSSGVDNVAHIGGLLAGVAEALVLYMTGVVGKSRMEGKR